jgi:hypothetical protein
MIKGLLGFFFVSFCFCSLNKWSIDKLIGYLEEQILNKKIMSKYILISPENILKEEEYEIISKIQKGMFINKEISTFIFILESLEEDINEFIFGIINKLAFIDTELKMQNSIVIVIDLQSEICSIICGKIFLNYINFDIIHSYQIELDQFIKTKRINEGIIKILNGISSYIIIIPWTKIIVVLGIIIILYLIKKYGRITRTRYINSKAPENLKINSNYQILKEKRAKEKREKMLRKEKIDEKTNLKKDK